MSAAENVLVPMADPVPDAEVVGAPLPGDPAFRIADTVVLQADPSGFAAESFRVLRTHILAKHLRLGRRALALCSPSRDVGCTSVAVNLAVGLAQVGVKTLLIDADLRTPSLQDYIVPSRQVMGLTQGLADDELVLDEMVQPDVLPNLSLIYAGGPAERPQELLASAGFKRLINACLRDFEMTIVNTPPANASADARQVASVVAYALMTVGRNRTFVSDVKTLASELQSDRVTIVGAVLTEE